MKTLLFLLLFFTVLTTVVFAVDDHAVCGTNEDIIDHQLESIPFYLRPDFGNQITLPVAIVYVDFPDGRLNGNDQIFTTSQMMDLLNQSGGMLDAVAELGIDSIDGTRKFRPAKYTYFDRWEMFFSTGTYFGDVHPDFNVYGDLAYGSMKEYFYEATNGKVIIEPMVTHPNATGDLRRMTGILNRDVVINGRHIIKSIRLDRNKYGQGGYFPSQGPPAFNDLQNDVLSKVDYLYGIGELDTNFADFNGQIVIIIAGGSGGVGGAAFGLRTSVNRGTTFHFSNNLNDPFNYINRMDGFRIPVHEISHNPPINFRFHTNSGRYCAMNPNSSALHPDCPPHFNPAIKIQKGWIDVIHFENSMQIDKLDPMVSSNTVGLITVYGKPSESPDNQTGEYFIVENRRLLGFDQKISDHLRFDGHPNFKGGLLIWHYSPYRAIPNNIFQTGTTVPYRNVKLLIPGENATIEIDRNWAGPEHFYGYYPTQPIPEIFRNRDTNLTYSSIPLRTGIKIKDIEQEQTVNSAVSFELEYQISEPPDYDYVIYNRDEQASIEVLNGSVYFHNFDANRYFEVNPSTIVETAGFGMGFSCMKARGGLNNPIIFRGAGFANQSESHRFTHVGVGFDIQTLFGTIDSLILENVGIENVHLFNSELNIVSASNVPVAMNNIMAAFKPAFDVYNIVCVGGMMSEFELNDLNVLLDYSDNPAYEMSFNCDVNLSNTNLTFRADTYFQDGTGLNLFNSYLRIEEGIRPGFLPVLDKAPTAESWSGIYIEDGNAYINKAEILNSTNGITLIRPTGSVVIDENVFSGNLIGDISIYDNSESQTEVTISNNTFNSPDDQYSSIDASELYDLTIENNEFINSGLASISLSYCFDPVVKNNIMTGTNEVNFSCGIISEGSSGYYECNTITNFNDFGIFLLNSQPTLFNNLITGNAYGLYVTNNSFPVLSPYFTPSVTQYVGGFNRIEYNSNEEIYVEDDLNPSEPFMLRGENTVQDYEQITPDILIYNGSVNSGNIIYAETNYWGGDEPVGRFEPEGSVEYDPWMTESPSDNCQISLITSNNSEMEESLLMFGSAMLEKYNGNYSNSDYLFRQLVGNNSSAIKKVMALSNVYYSSHLANEDLGTLRNYFLDFTSNSDTVVKRKSRDMAIETRVSIGELEDALDDYDNIINTSQIPLEIFYAQLGKLRVLRQLSFFQQGDNTIHEIPVMSQKLFNKNSKEIGNLNEKKPRFEKYIRLVNEGSYNTDANKIAIDRMVSIGLIHSKTGFNPKRGFSIHEQQSDLTMVPDRFQLFQNYPNPFNPETKIKFSIPSTAGNEALANLVVYDITGREVLQLLNNINVSIGVNEVIFDGRNLSSGVYFYKLEISGKYKFTDVKRMVLLK